MMRITQQQADSNSNSSSSSQTSPELSRATSLSLGTSSGGSSVTSGSGSGSPSDIGNLINLKKRGRCDSGDESYLFSRNQFITNFNGFDRDRGPLSHHHHHHHQQQQQQHQQARRELDDAPHANRNSTSTASDSAVMMMDFDADPPPSTASRPTGPLHAFSPSLAKLLSHACDVDDVPVRRAFGRDPDYYFEDGSCILLVGDTLFNVHRSMLSRDSSSFGTMFSLPQGDQEAEGQSDHNPIVLKGDTIAEFRNFLWALYALPPELQVLSLPNTDLQRLMDIARVANKYSFKTLETWSLDAIQEYVDQKPCPILNSTPPPPASSSFAPQQNQLSSPPASLSSSPGTSPNTRHIDSSLHSPAQLRQLIRLAQLCHHERLLNTLVLILKQLMKSSVHYAYLAMTLADEYDLHSLRGLAYLEVMQKATIARPCIGSLLGGANNDTATNTFDSHTGPNPDHSTHAATTNNINNLINGGHSSTTAFSQLSLSPTQRLRLLSGHYRLTLLWEHLRNTPPYFEHTNACHATWHQHGCNQKWHEFWKEKTKADAVLALGPADVLGRLRQVMKDFERWGSTTYIHQECRVAARKCVYALIGEVEERLSELFEDEE